MQVIIQILTDDGKMVVEQMWDALVPQTLRLKEPVKVPCILEGRQSGEYSYFGMQYQPIVRLHGKIGGY